MSYLPHTRNNVYVRYILDLTYIGGWHKVAANRVRLLSKAESVPPAEGRAMSALAANTWMLTNFRTLNELK